MTKTIRVMIYGTGHTVGVVERRIFRHGGRYCATIGGQRETLELSGMTPRDSMELVAHVSFDLLPNHLRRPGDDIDGHDCEVE